jgi:hypothetical protein
VTAQLAGHAFFPMIPRSLRLIQIGVGRLARRRRALETVQKVCTDSGPRSLVCVPCPDICGYTTGEALQAGRRSG